MTIPLKKMMKNSTMKIVLQVEKKCFFIDKRSTIFCDDLDESDNLGSDEESGKSWSELEEEARKG